MSFDFAPLIRQLAEHARLSPDPSTQNAAALLRPCGNGWALENTHFNGPCALADDPRYTTDRDFKLAVTVHAEEGAARGLGRHYPFNQMLALWASCSGCARDITAAGIRRLFRLDESCFPGGFPERWKKDIDIADEILQADGVDIVNLSFPTVIGAYWRWNSQEILV